MEAWISCALHVRQQEVKEVTSSRIRSTAVEKGSLNRIEYGPPSEVPRIPSCAKHGGKEIHPWLDRNVFHVLGRRGRGSPTKHMPVLWDGEGRVGAYAPVPLERFIHRSDVHRWPFVEIYEKLFVATRVNDVFDQRKRQRVLNICSMQTEASLVAPCFQLPIAYILTPLTLLPVLGS